jgi:hypothetical protein
MDMDGTGQTATGTKTGLHVCGGCGSGLVQPTRWEQTEVRGQWRLWRRCPECEWNCDAVHGEREIDAYDEVLDAGTQELNDVLGRLQRENMQRVADSLVAALEADLITADDFR